MKENETSKLKSVIDEYKLLLEEVPTMVTLAHIMSIVVMNLAALKVIFDIGSAAFTSGFLISWIPFLCMDTVTKRFGGRAAVMINNLAALVDLIVVIFFAITAAIPTPEKDYQAYNSIFSSTWFVLFSSMLALVLSGYVNSAINVAIGKLFKQGSALEFFARSYISTFIGQAVDNFVFFALLYCVFAPIYWGFSYPITTAIGTALFGGLLELLTEVIFSPIGYKTSLKWERNNVGSNYIEQYKGSAA